MTAGKNKLLKYARIYVNGYDLSGDARTFDSLDCQFGDQDMSGWSNQTRMYLADQRLIVGVRGFQALLNDAAAGAYTILKTPTGVTQKQVSVLFGGGAAPAAGDLAYLLAGAQLNDQSGLDGQALNIKADFLPMPGVTVGMPWGVVLHPATSLAATTNGTSINNGAGTTTGWQANLHVTVSSGGTWAFTIEHSTNGSSWSTLGTFTINGSAVASEHLTDVGTVNQYVRFVATRTGGSVTPICTFART